MRTLFSYIASPPTNSSVELYFFFASACINAEPLVRVNVRNSFSCLWVGRDLVRRPLVTYCTIDYSGADGGMRTAKGKPKNPEKASGPFYLPKNPTLPHMG
jgi:hypothetical protein